MHGFHHLRARVRLSKGLEPFPAKGVLKRFLDYVMYAVGILAPLAIVPQILQLYTTRSGAGLSFLTWSMLVVVNMLWTLYGIAHKDLHVFLASALMGLFNFIVVVGILLY